MIGLYTYRGQKANGMDDLQKILSLEGRRHLFLLSVSRLIHTDQNNCQDGAQKYSSAMKIPKKKEEPPRAEGKNRRNSHRLGPGETETYDCDTASQAEVCHRIARAQRLPQETHELTEESAHKKDDDSSLAAP